MVSIVVMVVSVMGVMVLVMLVVMGLMMVTMVKITMRPGEASGEQQKGAMPPFPSSS